MVLIDEMDYAEHWAQYSALDLPIGWHIALTEGKTQAEKIVNVWDEVKDCAWLGLIGDDCVPVTQGWDKTLVDHLDGTNIVSCDDGWQAPTRLGNCWMMAGPLVRAVGYIFPPSRRSRNGPELTVIADCADTPPRLHAARRTRVPA
jgi:hypothetical protein